MAASIIVELFSASSCHRCIQAKSCIQTWVNTIADDRVEYRELDVLDELDYAVSLGILTTPSIVINGELVFTRMPSLKRFNEELQKHLNSES